MTAALIVTITATAAALPLVFILRPGLPARTAVGLATLLGLGIAALLLLAMSLTGISWSLPLLTAAMLAFVLLYRFRRKWPEGAPIEKMSALALAIETLAYLPLVGFLRYARATAPLEGDFWSIWGYKARAFAARGAIDWQLLQGADNVYTHPDYPPLFPLMLDVVTLAAGYWDESAVAVLHALFAGALLLLVRDRFLQDFRSTLGASLATLAVANLVVVKWIGLADGVILVYITAGVLLLREALQKEDRRLTLVAAFILGFAAMIKNEGIALVVAVIVGTFLHNRRALLRLWPALVLASLWPLAKLSHSLPGDLTQSGGVDRAIGRLSNPNAWSGVASFLIPYREAIWIAGAISIVLAGWRFVVRERFLITVITLQTIFCLGAYLITPHDLKWHVATSWQRVSAQLTMLVAYLATVAAVHAIRSARIARPAEEARAA